MRLLWKFCEFRILNRCKKLHRKEKEALKCVAAKAQLQILGGNGPCHSLDKNLCGPFRSFEYYIYNDMSCKTTEHILLSYGDQNRAIPSSSPGAYYKDMTRRLGEY